MRPQQTSVFRQHCCRCGDEIGACELFVELTTLFGGAVAHPRCEPHPHRWRKVQGGLRCTACDQLNLASGGEARLLVYKTAHGVTQGVEDCPAKAPIGANK